MKKFWKRILSLLFVGILITGTFTGCNEEDTVVNAYEIAVKNGFVGTEKEWIQSLRGADGEDASDDTAQDLYQAAVEEER